MWRHMQGYAKDLIVEMPLEQMKVYLPSITGYGMLLAMLFRKIYHTRRKSHAILPSPLFWSSHYKFANSSQLQTDFEFIGKVLPFVVFLSLTCEAALECVVKWVQYRTQSWPWNFLPRMFLMIFCFFVFFLLLFPLIPMLISLMIMVSVWWNDVSWMVFVLGI